MKLENQSGETNVCVSNVLTDKEQYTPIEQSKFVADNVVHLLSSINPG